MSHRPIGRPRKELPALCHHRTSGRAYVRLAGRQVWLGKFGTREAQDRYNVVVGEWISSGRPADPAISQAEPGRHGVTSGPTIAQIADAYWQHAQAYYRPVPGRSTGHLKVIRSALRLLVRLYGDTLVAKFGPVALTTVRDAMAKPKTIKGWRRIEDPGTGKKIRRQVEVERPGWSRKFCNAQLVRLKAVFRWAASRELIPASIVMALDTVDGLRKGKCEARETQPVKPARELDVEAVLPHLSPIVQAMVKLEALTGMRPGEVRIMRTCDIDRSGKVWIYCPQFHKTDARGASREIPLGPRAQEVVVPYLTLDGERYLFRPEEAIAWHFNNPRTRRPDRKLYPCDTRKREAARRRRERQGTMVKCGACYTDGGYAQAIRRGCKRAGLDRHFTPNQLRHLVATKIRREFGLEAAQVVLGHARADVTQVYAERNLSLARDIAAAIA